MGSALRCSQLGTATCKSPRHVSAERASTKGAITSFPERPCQAGIPQKLAHHRRRRILKPAAWPAN
eukprot:12936977-Prorocentrum_lima.AAC.1